MAVKPGNNFNFNKEFCDAVKAAYNKKGKLTSNIFFSEWFRKKGKALFFLFKKNLSTTSIQFAELLSLLQVHVKEYNGKSIDLQFIALKEFLRNYDEFLTDFQNTNINADNLSKTLLELYASTLRRQIVVELFFGSCTVFLPPHLEIDLAAVCRESGYIHSCGQNIYTRRLEDVEGEDLISTLRTYITSKSTQSMKSYVQVYAHEDFTDHDRRYAKELRGGLDDTKIYIEKYYIGNRRFVSFLDDLKEKLNDIIVMPGPGPYRKQREEAIKRKDLDKTYTIWFMIDRALSDVSNQAGEGRYLISYEQGFRNYNPFHFFDENKPAWVAHTTIPHTLAGAMINITRPWWKEKNEVLIADPFSGTGTIWLEAQKFENIKLYCSDLSPVSSLLANDNRFFFMLDSKGLENLKTDIESLVKNAKTLNSPNSHRTSPKNMSYQEALTIFDNIVKHNSKDGSFNFTTSNVTELKKLQFVERLLFYLCMRTYIRQWGALARGSKGWELAFTQEYDVLFHQIEQLYSLRKKEEYDCLEKKGNFIKFIGTYSLGTSINIPELHSNNRETSVKIMDARQKNTLKVDVIITDPPYGFNTDEDIVELASTYSGALRNMISMLKDGGQLVIAVPEKTFTGRRVATYATKGWLTQQILAEARDLGYEAVVGAQVFPRPGRIFWPPYYWESERALRRMILHFRFRKVSKKK